MAGELDISGDGRAAYIGARKHAWHRMGETVADAFTAEDAMTKGHLGGWCVRKVPMTAADITPNGVEVIDVPDRWATVRTSPWTGRAEALGVVGAQYQIVQNEEHAEVLDALVGESGAHFETAGALRGGREVFVTMKLPRRFSIGGVDELDLYLAALNSHDGTGAFQIIVTPVRIVCANTQRAALADTRSRYSIRHTRNVKAAIDEARKALGMAEDFVSAFTSEADQLLARELDALTFEAMVSEAFGPKSGMGKRQAQNAQDGVDAVVTLFSAPTQANIAGTAWAGYQAVTEYVDHFAPVRARRGQDEALVRAERAVLSPDVAAVKAHAWGMMRSLV